NRTRHGAEILARRVRTRQTWRCCDTLPRSPVAEERSMGPSKPRRNAPKSAPGKASPRRRPKPVVETDASAEMRERRLSWRPGIFLGVIAIVLFAFLAPLNSALKQAQQIAAPNHEIETTQAEVDNLEEKSENLKDPDYIKRKARADQYYVEKGKNAVIVTNQDRKSTRL